MSGARAILAEMLDLLRSQVSSAAKGDVQALLEGSAQHEQLLTALATAPVDASPEELRGLWEEIEQQKEHLQSLLAVESHRVDFLLRLIFGGEEQKSVGYSAAGRRTEPTARMLNTRA